ncbi:MAG: MotA/TolQ/ExbB proton channel family protein [Cytophagaceae bacterium]
MKSRATKSKGIKPYFAIIVILSTLIISGLLFWFVFGHSSNFINNNPLNNPKSGNYFGIIYKGGFIVPFLMSFLMMVITFSIERAYTITMASGKGEIEDFVQDIKELISENKLDEALQECDVQKGSVGNAARAVLLKYIQMSKEQGLTKDQKIMAIQKELEDATSLELPMLEKNLTIIATLASISTLIGLLGTVIGMIKAFAALAVAGTPNATELANGISEALVNTALGIATSALAIVAYNYFTSKIDTLTYSIDEVGFSISQTFSATQK